MSTAYINSYEGIGERIRRLRLAKGLTQSELAGGEITRNMLCVIEKGNALPSVPTLVHIANRLDIPCGCLFDDLALSEYYKNEKIKKSRECIKNARYAEALSVLDGEAGDDEITLIRLECDLALAKLATKEARYEEAYRYLADAVEMTDKTVYSTLGSGSEAALYYEIAKRSLPYPGPECSVEDFDFSKHLDLYVYIKLITLFDGGDIIKATNLSSVCEISDPVLSKHIAAKLDMARGRYNDAVSKLENIVSLNESETGAHGAMILFKVFDDLEACAKAQGDYVSAYTCKERKLKLYEFTSGIKL